MFNTCCIVIRPAHKVFRLVYITTLGPIRGTNNDSTRIFTIESVKISSLNSFYGENVFLSNFLFCILALFCPILCQNNKILYQEIDCLQSIQRKL